jgi:hypothetical protein
MKTVMTLLSFVTAFSLASVASAQQLSKAGNYGMAGCGLGSLVFEKQPGKIQILAATTNDVVFPQTSAITTGSSNCVADERGYAANYIKVNREALKTDIARGQGETLIGLAVVLKCQNSDSMNKTLQHNYKEIFSTDKTEATVQQIESVIKINKVNCAVLS